MINQHLGGIFKTQKYAPCGFLLFILSLLFLMIRLWSRRIAYDNKLARDYFSNKCFRVNGRKFFAFDVKEEIMFAKRIILRITKYFQDNFSTFLK